MMTNRLHPLPSTLLLGASLLSSLAAASGDSTFPLMTNCFEDAERIAVVSAADQVRVRYASAAGGVKPCYAVQVTKEGRPLTGFLVGATLPAIQLFEADVRKHVPQIPPPPPPPPVSAAAAGATPPPDPEPPGPTSLAGLRAPDISGNLVDLSAMPDKHLVVYFWSASDRKAIQAADAMEGIHTQYAVPRKLEFVSIATAKSLDQYKRAAEGAEATWPQILDKGKLADRYHVNPAKPFLILDRSRNVIASVATPRDLIAELKRLGVK